MKKTTIAAPEQVSKFEQLKAKKLIPPEQYDELKKVMKKLGYDDFLSLEQGEITIKFLKGENVFGVLPTSGGKSFTFQTVARMKDGDNKDGLTIVVSPLIALMKDQVAKFRDGASLYFNSDLSDFQKKDVKRRIREGKVGLLYISPERLKSAEFKELLDSGKQRVKRIVVDEAHCVIEWGYGFRAKYLHIAQEIEAFEKSLKSKVPVLLLTATASPWLQRQIVEKLRVKIKDENFITQTKDADRPELVISLRPLKNEQKKIDWIKKQLARGGDFHKKRGIIFSAYADGGESKGAYNAEKIFKELKRLGVKKISYYHGGMNLDERRSIQKNFQDGVLDILIATKAFGMGIDLPELDFIVHYYPPISLEEYWQEAGRGGRGMETGQRCQCVVLHAPTDQKLLDNFTISTSFTSMLSTFTCATQGVVCFNIKDITKGGNLRKLLTNLHKQKNIRKLKNIQVGRTTIERWKLLKSPNAVLKNMDRLFKNKAMKKTEQIRKTMNNRLQLRSDIKEGNIRIGRRLQHFNSQLNWFTEPDIQALAMIDDEINGKTIYTRFKILKKNLSLKEIKMLAEKVSDFHSDIKRKFNYVHNRFLTAKRGEEKVVILKYLSRKQPPT